MQAHHAWSARTAIFIWGVISDGAPKRARNQRRAIRAAASSSGVASTAIGSLSSSSVGSATHAAPATTATTTPQSTSPDTKTASQAPAHLRPKKPRRNHRFWNRQKTHRQTGAAGPLREAPQRCNSARSANEMTTNDHSPATVRYHHDANRST